MKIDTTKLVVKITDVIGTINTLKIVFLIIVFWLIFGQLSKIDPYPYLFSSTVTNYLGFVLTIAILISTKSLEKFQQSLEKKAEEHQEQHYKMQEREEKLVKHLTDNQDAQKKLLLEIAKKLDIEI